MGEKIFFEGGPGTLSPGSASLVFREIGTSSTFEIPKGLRKSAGGASHRDLIRSSNPPRKGGGRSRSCHDAAMGDLRFPAPLPGLDGVRVRVRWLVPPAKFRCPCRGASVQSSRMRLAFGAILRLISLMASGSKNLSVKKAAARLVRELPDSASWDDLMYQILVRQKIEAGLNDLREGRVHEHRDIRREFGLP